MNPLTIMAGLGLGEAPAHQVEELFLTELGHGRLVTDVDV